MRPLISPLLNLVLSYCIVQSVYGQAIMTTIPQSHDPVLLEEGHQLKRLHAHGHAELYLEDYLSHRYPYESAGLYLDPIYASGELVLNRLQQHRSASLYSADRFIRFYPTFPITNQIRLTSGQTLYIQKNYRGALEYYRQIDIRTLDKHQAGEVAFKRGFAQFNLKNYRDAIEDFRLCADYETSYYYPSQYYLGIAQFNLGHYAEATKAFRLASPSQQFKFDVPYYLVQIYFNEKNYQEVISYGQKQLNIPDIKHKGEIKNLIGKSYYELGDETKALEYLRASESELADLSDADHFQIGTLAYKEGSYEEAILHLQKLALKKDETGEQAAYYLAHAYLNSGNKEKAASSFAQVTRQASNPTIKEEATYNAGLLSADLGRDREAVNTLLKIKPESDYYQQSQEALYQLFAQTEDYDHALNIIDQLNNQSPIIRSAEQRLHYLKAEQLMLNGHDQEALPHLEKAIEIPVDLAIQANSHYLKGWILQRLGRYDDSQGELTSLSSLSSHALPEYVHHALYLSGYNAFKKERYAQAKQYFDQYINYGDPSSPKTKTLLADAYMRRADCMLLINRYNDALHDYTKSYEMNAVNSDYAYFQIGILYGLQGDAIQKLAVLDDLADRYPQSPYADDALLESGKTSLSLAHLDQAAQPLIRLTNEYPQSALNAQAYLTLGLISYNKGSINEAIKYYQAVFEHNPSQLEHQDALLALEEIYVNDLKEPSTYVEIIESVTGNKVDVQVKDSLSFKSAERLYKDAQYAQAAEYLSNYIRDFPKGIHLLEALHLRAECYVLIENFSSAYRDYVAVVDHGASPYLEPSSKKAAIIAYNEIHRFDEALKYYKIYGKLNLDPASSLEASIGGMRSAYRSGVTKDCIAFAGQVRQHPLATSDQQLEADYYTAKIQFDEKAYEAALLPLNRLSENGKTEHAAEARYLIAKIYWLKNELNIAEEMSRLAVNNNSQSPYWVAKSILLLSDVLMAKQDYFNAKAGLEAILEHFHENEEIVSEAKAKIEEINRLNQIEE